MSSTGSKTKIKSKNIKEALGCASPKMAPTRASQRDPCRPSPSRSARSLKSICDDTGSRTSSPSPNREESSQKNLLLKIDKMLQKALQHTSKQITEKLTKEIRDLGYRTAELESRMDTVQNTLDLHEKDIEAVKDDNHQLKTWRTDPVGLI